MQNTAKNSLHDYDVTNIHEDQYQTLPPAEKDDSQSESCLQPIKIRIIDRTTQK